ncbi:MAG: ABC transporter substrate-binding protein [bacterium]|nr:ABC transporter substrate-binding protein [bacterium]
MKNSRFGGKLVLIVLLAVFSLQFSTIVTAQTPTPVPPVPRPEGSTEIVFWYGLGGNLGNVVQEVVNQYNSSQTTYYVNAVFQSSYDDTINKINAGLASGDLPDLAQIFEAGTQRMIDSGAIVPVQQYFERDGMLDVIEDMEPAVRANYEVDGTLYSAPFNSSTAMLYINRAAAAEAGINADEPLVTYDQVAEYARAMTVRDASGNVTRYGLGVYAEGWFLEQIHAVHDTFIGLPDNGRAGERMTAYNYNSPAGVEWVEFLKGLVDEGVAIYYGPAAGGSNASAAAFANNEVAMHFASIASLRGLIASAEGAGQGVEVGTLYMPRNESATGKTIVGGASLWITNVRGEEIQEGAWDFIKFALTPETQAFWAVNTGYYPVVRASYDLPEMQEGLELYPQFQVAIDQIRLTDITDANTAHVSGIFVPYRTHYVEAFDRYFNGEFATAQEALDAAVAISNEQLEEYNLTVGE